MTNYDELVKNLRGVDHASVEDCFLMSPSFAKAADAIEALVKERDDANSDATRFQSYVIEAENNTMFAVQRAEAAEAEAKRLQELCDLKKNLTMEVVRLREALTKIADTGLDDEADKGGDGGYADPDSLILVARKALELK